MGASHGDNSSGVHGDGFQAITAYFEQRACRACSKPYTADGIELVREEPGVVVVKVGCSACGHPLGIALVGMNAQSQSQSAPQHCVHGRPNGRNTQKNYPSEWTKKDADRLTGKPAITYDDVLSAHQFFQNLGSDWAQQLPKVAGKRAV